MKFFRKVSEDTRIRPSEIAEFFGINTIRMLKYMDEIDGLVKMRYIRTSKRPDDTTYKVPPQVIKCMYHNKPFVYEVEPVKNTQDFFDRFKTITKERFLYKIKFEKPSLEAKAEIWKSMMKGLKVNSRH